MVGQSGFPIDLAGRYSFIKLLGRGRGGVVYQAHDTSLGIDVAIKTLPMKPHNQKSLVRFQKEAKALSRFFHPNLTRVYDLGVTRNGLPYMSMEYVPGTPLSEILAVGPIVDLGEALAIFAQVLKAVDHAHKHGVLHRDLKSANIILEDGQNQGGAPKIRVIDFGVAQLRTLEERSIIETTGKVGSPAYMSPESIRGEIIDARSDIYSLGCLFFECLTGRTPFIADSSLEMARLHAEGIAPRLAEFIPPQPSSMPSHSILVERLQLVIEKCL